MIRRNGPLIQDQTRRRIFVSAIFEIDKGHPLPVNKKELVELLDKKVVIPFHQRVCPTCHNIPNSQKWTEKYDERRQIFLLCVPEASKATYVFVFTFQL